MTAHDEISEVVVVVVVVIFIFFNSSSSSCSSSSGEDKTFRTLLLDTFVLVCIQIQGLWKSWTQMSFVIQALDATQTLDFCFLSQT